MRTQHHGSAGLAPWAPAETLGLATRARISETDSNDVVVCVHGTLDRAASFGRVARRLRAGSVIAYDRRGYQGSRGLGATVQISDHVDDCLDIIELAAELGPVTLLGHSFGGIVALAAALRSPEHLDAVVLYEPPLPWFHPEGRRNRDAAPMGPASVEVERFFSRMVSPEAWDRLSDDARQDRIADGAALVGDLTIIRGHPPFTLDDVATLVAPLTVGLGSSSAMAHHRAGATSVVDAAPSAELVSLDDAGHGAHLSHPDQLAALVNTASRRPLDTYQVKEQHVS